MIVKGAPEIHYRFGGISTAHCTNIITTNINYSEITIISIFIPEVWGVCCWRPSDSKSPPVLLLIFSQIADMMVVHIFHPDIVGLVILVHRFSLIVDSCQWELLISNWRLSDSKSPCYFLSILFCITFISTDGPASSLDFLFFQLFFLGSSGLISVIR